MSGNILGSLEMEQIWHRNFLLSGIFHPSGKTDVHMRNEEEENNNKNILTPQKKLTMKNLVKKNSEIESSGIKHSQVIPLASELRRSALRRNI